ncbi:hypothetical protein CKA32_001392 [Geitlerinema sp. FC II]|nr:hypothetical protein CKA32_001392 [Geitlerinema sp. FC II]
MAASPGRNKASEFQSLKGILVNFNSSTCETRISNESFNPSKGFW